MQFTEPGAIEAVVDGILSVTPRFKRRALVPRSSGFLVGKAMKATGGKANPAAVKAIVTARLGR